jgi:hypothetical protein
MNTGNEGCAYDRQLLLEGRGHARTHGAGGMAMSKLDDG